MSPQVKPMPRRQLAKAEVAGHRLRAGGAGEDAAPLRRGGAESELSVSVRAPAVGLPAGVDAAGVGLTRGERDELDAVGKRDGRGVGRRRADAELSIDARAPAHGPGLAAPTQAWRSPRAMTARCGRWCGIEGVIAAGAAKEEEAEQRYVNGPRPESSRHACETSSARDLTLVPAAPSRMPIGPGTPRIAPLVAVHTSAPSSMIA